MKLMIDILFAHVILDFTIHKVYRLYNKYIAEKYSTYAMLKQSYALSVQCCVICRHYCACVTYKPMVLGNTVTHILAKQKGLTFISPLNINDAA